MDTAKYFFPEGGIVPGHRAVQLQMAGIVDDVLADKGIVFVEAKTGTGKSLAYSIPTVGMLRDYYKPASESPLPGREIVGMATKNGPLIARPRVIISTAKKSLQHQIVGKDLPRVTSVMAPSLPFALLKGKSNYLCALRAADFLDPKKLLRNQRDYEPSQIEKFEHWMETTPTGDLGELPGFPFLFRVGVTECLKRACPHHEECSYLDRKAEFQRTAIGLVNHHFLAYEILIGRGALFGPYDQLVIDEAQQLIGAVREAFATALTSKFPEQLRRQLMGAFGDRSTEEIEGAFTALFRVLDLKPEGELVASTDLLRVTDDAIGALADVRKQIGEHIKSYLDLNAEIDDAWALDYEALRGMAPPEIGAIINAAHGATQITRALAALRRMIGKNPDAELVAELLAQGRISQPEADAHLAKTHDIDYVCHLQISRGARGDWTEIRTEPVDVGPMIAPFLKEMKSVVITSATLANDGDFEYILRQFGLRAEDVKTTVALPHVFDYKRQSCIFVDDDVPPPDFYKGTVTREDYFAAIAKSTHELLQASGGGAFVLTTSWDDLYAIRDRLLKMPPPIEYNLIVQSRNVQDDVETFKGGMHNVLLATKSVWEGVDVPGLGLRMVIVTKLPFPPERDVIIKHQKRRIMDHYIDAGKDEKGANMIAFGKVCVAAVGIELAQGVGRLIRSEGDRGVVAVLDSRIGFRRPAMRGYARELRSVFPVPPINQRAVALELAALYRKRAEKQAQSKEG